MWWWLLPVGIILILAYVLFAPFFIEIDTNDDLYRARFHWFAKINFILTDESLYAKVRIAWWQKEINMLEMKHAAKELTKERSKKGNTLVFDKFYSKAKGIFLSFQVKKCYIMIDTGDMSLNGKLYPFFYYLSCISDRIIMINFKGENTVVLKIQNSIARVLWALIRS